MPKIVDHNQYRKHLLKNCFDLFAEKGYTSLTMRQIAHGLGVSNGTLYHYFPSKEALFLQLVEEQTQQDTVNFVAEVNNANALPERIEAMINFVAQYEDYFFKQTVLSFEFYQHKGRTHVLNNKVMRNSWEKNRQVIADCLQILDIVIAEFILNCISGLIIGLLHKDQYVDFKQQCTLLKKMLIAYLE